MELPEAFGRRLVLSLQTEIEVRARGRPLFKSLIKEAALAYERRNFVRARGFGLSFPKLSEARQADRAFLSSFTTLNFLRIFIKLIR